MIIIEILKNIIVPLLLLISAGYILNRIFSFHVITLSKLTLYFYIPILVFTKIYDTNLNFKLLVLIVFIVCVQVICLYGLNYFVSRILQFNKKIRASFVNSVILTNAGNFGLPVNSLAFNHDPLAMSVQIIVMAIQNFMTFSLGIMNAKSSADASILQDLIGYIKSPIFFAVFLGIIGNITNVEIPLFLKEPIWSIADGFFVIALITFGAQITFKDLKGYFAPLLASVFIRLVVSPAIAFGILLLLNINGVVAAALFIASALPTSRNSALIALDYDNHPDFAAQAVLFSTLFGSLSITFIIYLATIYFL
ncbi:AEC family transporter [Alkalihalobacillus deserti]|uniref:AEC family transporter n=1 Tax=Alkalihalobacillus deserti TaxID=2879466 RepID=UPI001D13CF66|nr:AEC family transporter [Alkalihalobacillus deserti]